MVFSLKNIDDAGFGLHDGSKLGSLINRKSGSPRNQAELANVWGSCGHVFVATNSGRNLHALESIPRSKWTPESESLLLQDQESPIVSVLSSVENPSLVFIIHQNSITECWEFTQSNYKWIKRNEFQLSNTKGVEILHVILHPLVNAFFWCERRSVSASNLITCCVCLRDVTVSERLGNNTVVCAGPLVVILHGSPAMSLHVIGRNICLVPDFPEELRSFILFWRFVQRSLKVYIWNYGLIGDVDTFDFRAIVTELVCPWMSGTNSGRHHLIALTSHPTTNELLVLRSDLELSYFKLGDIDPVLTPLVKPLLDSSFTNDKVSLFFAFDLIVGLVWDSGVIVLYDIHSGANICKLEDLQGQNVHIWKSFHLANSIGFWSISGIWKLQSGSVLEISECIRSSISLANIITGETSSSVIQGRSNESSSKTSTSHKSCFIADDPSLRTEFDTSPEEFVIPEIVQDQEMFSSRSTTKQSTCMNINERLFTGPLLAASQLMKWNLNHRAAKLALDSVVCSTILPDCALKDSEIPRYFLDLLVSEHAQGPALALALLWEHPMHREFILQRLEQYVSERVEKPRIDKTFLNELLHPYLSEFVLLSKQCKSAIDSGFNKTPQSPSLPTNSVGQEVPALLKAFDNGPLDMRSLERLSTLSHQQPHKVLECVTEYLKIDSKQVDSQGHHLEQRWRKLYRLQWKNGQWQRSRIALKDPFNALLSILLRIFYDSKSEWLMRMVEKGMDTIQLAESDESTEEYLTQSVLECLPLLRTSDVNTKSILMHSQLCYSIGQETQALHLLLSSQMWKEAIDFVSCCGKSSENSTLLFVMLIKGLQSGRAPSEMLIEALNIKPKGFSTYELLAIMRDQAPVAKEPFPKGAEQATVGEVRPFLAALFSS